MSSSAVKITRVDFRRDKRIRPIAEQYFRVRVQISKEKYRVLIIYFTSGNSEAYYAYAKQLAMLTISNELVPYEFIYDKVLFVANKVVSGSRISTYESFRGIWRYGLAKGSYTKIYTFPGEKEFDFKSGQKASLLNNIFRTHKDIKEDIKGYSFCTHKTHFKGIEPGEVLDIGTEPSSKLPQELDDFLFEKQFKDNPYWDGPSLSHPVKTMIDLEHIVFNRSEIERLETFYDKASNKLMVLEGPPASGKTIIASKLGYNLHRKGCPVYYFDFRLLGEILSKNNDTIRWSLLPKMRSFELLPSNSLLIFDNCNIEYDCKPSYLEALLNNLTITSRFLLIYRRSGIHYNTRECRPTISSILLGELRDTNLTSVDLTGDIIDSMLGNYLIHEDDFMNQCHKALTLEIEGLWELSIWLSALSGDKPVSDNPFQDAIYKQLNLEESNMPFYCMEVLSAFGQFDISVRKNIILSEFPDIAYDIDVYIKYGEVLEIGNYLVFPHVSRARIINKWISKGFFGSAGNCPSTDDDICNVLNEAKILRRYFDRSSEHEVLRFLNHLSKYTAELPSADMKYILKRATILLWLIPIYHKRMLRYLINHKSELTSVIKIYEPIVFVSEVIFGDTLEDQIVNSYAARLLKRISNEEMSMERIQSYLECHCRFDRPHLSGPK